MKSLSKIIIIAWLMMSAFAAIGQTIVKGGGIIYTNGAPTHSVTVSVDAEIAIDTASGLWYEYQRDAAAWAQAGFRIQKRGTCTAPTAAPTDKQSEIVLNSCDSLYRYASGSWRHINKVADNSAANEGLLGVGAGSGTTSVITSNTTGATGVTITASTGLSISETTSSNGGTITLTNTGDTNASDDLTTSTTFGGDVTGTYNATVVGDNSHNHDATTITTNIVSSVEGVTNDGGNIDLVPGAGISVTGDDPTNAITITNTGDTNAADDLTTTTEFSGDVSGTYDATVVADNSHDHDESTITPDIISSIGGVSNDGGAISLIQGNGIMIVGDDPANTITITNVGDTDGTDDVNIGAAAGGDLSGTYPNPTVNQVDGTPVTATGATSGQVLKWNGTAWAPGSDLTGTSTEGLIPVQAFGAAVDGTTDDAAAIQESLDSLGYAFILYDERAGYTQCRINSAINVDQGIVFSNNRQMKILCHVTSGQYAFNFTSVPFLGYGEIANLTIQQNTASGGVYAFECRQVHIRNVTFLGNTTGTAAIYFTGGGTNGSAWNHVSDVLAYDYTYGIRLETTGAVEYCNRNFVDNATFQQCDTAIHMKRASTNMFQGVGCQNSTIHIWLQSAQRNYFLVMNETQSSFSAFLDADSYKNAFHGNVVESSLNSYVGNNAFYSPNYQVIQSISADLRFDNLPLSAPSSAGRAVIGTALGSTDTLSLAVASNRVIDIIEAGSNDKVNITENTYLSTGKKLYIDNLEVRPQQTVKLDNPYYLDYGPMDNSTALVWHCPAQYNGWTVTAIRYSVGYNGSTTNIQGRTSVNGGADTMTRNITTGSTSSELTSAAQALSTGDRLTFKLGNGSTSAIVNGFFVEMTLSKS